MVVRGARETRRAGVSGSRSVKQHHALKKRVLWQTVRIAENGGKYPDENGVVSSIIVVAGWEIGVLSQRKQFCGSGEGRG